MGVAWGSHVLTSSCSLRPFPFALMRCSKISTMFGTRASKERLEVKSLQQHADNLPCAVCNLYSEKGNEWVITSLHIFVCYNCRTAFKTLGFDHKVGHHLPGLKLDGGFLNAVEDELCPGSFKQRAPRQ